MNPETKWLQRRYRSLKAMHEAVFRDILRTREPVENRQIKSEDLVDMAYVLREMAALADDIRRECAAHQGLMEKAACIEWVVRNDPTGPIRGELAVGTPDLKQMSSLPKPKTEPAEYRAMMLYLGVPENLHDVVRPHWPAMVDWISDLTAQGKPLPPGIDLTKTYPVYRLRLLKKKAVDEA